MTLRRDFATLIFGPHLAFDLVGFTMLTFVHHLAFAPCRVADEVKTAHLRVEASQKTIVSDPVSHEVGEPSNALRPIVIGSRHAHLTRKGGIPVHTFRSFGDAKLVGDRCRWMAAIVVQGDFMGTNEQTAPAA